MSGHSKWAKIKRQKGLNDQKKGAIFTKLGRNITLAAKDGGGDPDTNFALRLAIDKAKSVNMPLDNIERSIKKGIGGSDKSSFSKISYEAILHGGVSLLIDCQTDNTNRTVAEIKKILEMGGGKMASVGSVTWQYSELGLITIKPAKLKKSEKFGGEDKYLEVSKDDLEMDLIEIEGVDDIYEDKYIDDNDNEINVIQVVTNKANFSKVVKNIEGKNYQILSYELIKKPNEFIDIDKENMEKAERLIENLEDHDDVDSVWFNIKIK